MRPVAWIAALVATLFPLAPGDAAAKSSMKLGGLVGGRVWVRAAWDAPDTCQTVLALRRERGIDSWTLKVTLVVGRNPAGCGTSRTVTRSFSMSRGINADVVEIIFATEDGRVLSREMIPI